MSQRDRIRLQAEETSTLQNEEQHQSEQTHDAPQHTSVKDSPAQSVLQMQRTHGNRAVQRMLGQVQRVPFENGGELDDQLSSEINSKRGTGGSLDSTVASTAGSHLGADFSSVSVHTDPQADRISRSIGAKAFTTGSDIFFKSGEYNPGSSSGQQLLTHELTHVVQQGGQAPSGKLSVGPANDSYESEADTMAQSLTSSSSDTGVQREAEEEEMMMMRDDIQREEEEDEMMLMRDDIQREEEEDEMMMMRDDVQREELDEDEMAV